MELSGEGPLAEREEIMAKAPNIKISEANGSFLVAHVEGKTPNHRFASASVRFKFDPETCGIKFYVAGDAFHLMTADERFFARPDIVNEQGEYRSGHMHPSEVNDGGGCSGFFDTAAEAIEFAKCIVSQS
jgi:hypothetical protein